jgi:hypothetical protein
MDGCISPNAYVGMPKENKGNRPERQFAALAKQALRTPVCI